MRIGAVARATGVSHRLLRYYEERGLLQPARSPSGYREYAPADVAAVRNIRTLLAAGLSLRVIADVLPCICEHSERIVPTCPEFVAHVRDEQDRIRAAMGELKNSQRLLDLVLDAAPAPVLAAADRARADASGAGASGAGARRAERRRRLPSPGAGELNRAG